jgi:hypothetical protein
MVGMNLTMGYVSIYRNVTVKPLVQLIYANKKCLKTPCINITRYGQLPPPGEEPS